MTESSQPVARYVVSILIRDRVGILRALTAALADLGANIDGISQTVVEGYFTVILTATFKKNTTSDTIHQAIADRFAQGEVDIAVRQYISPDASAPTPAIPTSAYIVTLIGPDQPGILKAVTSFFAEKKINVETWFVQFDVANVTHIGRVTVPEPLDIGQVQSEFRRLAAQFGLTASVQHENIFRATNETTPVKRLLGINHYVGN